MSYATGGSGGTITDLLDAIRAFAAGEGWTIDKYDGPNKLLFLTKGLCAVTMQGFTNDIVNVYSGANSSGVFAATADHRLYMALNMANNPALAVYHGHTGAIITASKEGESVVVNGLNGPFVGWHLFADATIGDHIHVVVQINAECFMHFSFGSLDQRGLTHSGVAYLTGCGNTYYRNVSTYLTTNPNAFNDPQGVNYPFCFTSGNNSMVWGTHLNSPGLHLKHIDAWPLAWGVHQIQGSFGTPPHQGLCLPLIRTSEVYHPDNFPRQNYQGAMLNLEILQEPTPYSNVSPLLPLPVWRWYYNTGIASSDRICYVGDFPNVRAVNLTNLVPGQEIAVDSDTWKIFPALRKSNWSDRGFDPQPQSGMHGIAYKKV